MATDPYSGGVPPPACVPWACRRTIKVRWQSDAPPPDNYTRNADREVWEGDNAPDWTGGVMTWPGLGWWWSTWPGPDRP